MDVPATRTALAKRVGQWVKQPRADEHPVVVYLGSLSSPASRRSMKHSLERVAATLTGGKLDALQLDWSRIEYQHTARFRALLAEGRSMTWKPQGIGKAGKDKPRVLEEGKLSPAACNRILAALKGVLKETWRLKLMSADDYMRAAALKPIKAQRLLRGRLISEGELKALFRTCKKDSTPVAMRDRAILAVLFGLGLRRAEVCSLDMAHITTVADEPALEIRSAKGNRDRLAFLQNGPRDALNDWLDVRGNEPGPMFWAFDLQGKPVPGRRLTEQAVYYVLTRRAEQAGIGRVSPHDGRRTFISNALDACGDVSLVAKLAGHAKIDTTMAYDLRGDRERARVAGMVFVPVDG